MQRRTKKVARALSLKARRKPSLSSVIPMPKPQFEFEDTLVSQLRASDVLANCYEEYDGDITVGNGCEPTSPRKHAVLRHHCHYDNNLVPLWQAFYNLDRRGSGAVLLGRLMNLSALVGPIINERFISERTVHEHFIDTTHVTFNQYKHFIEKCVDRNPLAFSIDWQKLRAFCWSQCETWHLQALPFDIPEGNVPPELNYALYWLWCVFNTLTETDTYPPSADYEEVELLLRKLFSSIGLLWEEYDDTSSTVSGSSLSSNATSPLEQNGGNNNSIRSFDGNNLRIVDNDPMDVEDPSNPGVETLLVTFQQFLSIIADMLGSETVLSPAFGRAVRQIYLTEVDEIIITGWLSLKKPGTDAWKKRWTVLRKNNVQFYSNTSCEVVKYQITLNHKMHVESLPDTSSHKHRFRLVEREGDFNIAWEAEMSSTDAQHSHSWMLVMNLSMKIQQTGLTAKRIEVAERRLERHRRRESELTAIEKRKEVRRTRKRLQEIRERWNLMQTRLSERAVARDTAMSNMQKMDEIYDKLQSVTKKQSLIRRADRRIRSAFPTLSNVNSVLTKEEKLLMDSRDEKLEEHRKKMQKLEDDKKRLEEQLLELQAASMLMKDNEKTLILVYGPEKQASFLKEPQERRRTSSVNVANSMNESRRQWRRSPVPMPPAKRDIPVISISTTALTFDPPTLSSLPSMLSQHSKSHPELRVDDVVTNGIDRADDKNVLLSSMDSDLSELSGERLV